MPTLAGAFTGATAYMRLRVDSSALKRDVAAGVSGAGMGTAGARAGTEYAAGMRRSLAGLRGVFATVGVLGFAAGLGAAVKAGEQLEFSQSRVEMAVKRTGVSWDRYAPQLARAQQQMERWGFTTSDTNSTLSALIRQTGDSNKALQLLNITANVAAQRNIGLSDALAIVRTGIIGNQRSLRQFNVTAATGITMAQAMAKAQTILADQIKQAGGMANFARSRNLSLAQATTLADQAARGSIPAFNRLGIEVLPQAATSAARADQFIRVMTARLGGQAASRAQTFGGQIMVLRAELTDMAARGAMVVLPFLTGLLRAFTGAGLGATILRDALISLALALAVGKGVIMLYGALRTVKAAFDLASLAAQAYTVREIIAQGAAMKLTMAQRILAITLRTGIAGFLATVTVVGAMAVGFVYLSNVLARGHRTVEDYTTAVDKQAKTIGFNEAGYYKLAKAVSQVTASQIINGRSTGAVSRAYDYYSIVTDRLNAKQQALVQQGRNVGGYLVSLQQQYGLTRDQAIRLAAAAGVQATEFAKGGMAGAKAMDQVRKYADTNRAASGSVSQFNRDLEIVGNTTLSVSDRSNALADALDRVLGNYNSLIGQHVSAKRALFDLADAVREDGVQTGFASRKQLDLTDHLAAATDQALKFANATFQQTGNVKKAVGPLMDELRTIHQLGLKGPIARQETNKLVSSIAALGRKAGMTDGDIAAMIHRITGIPKKVILNIIMHGRGDVHVTGTSVGMGGQRYGGSGPGVTGGGALGAYIRAGTTPTADDVLIRVSKGELVVPTRLVDAGAVDHLRGLIPGFAAGGPTWTGNRGVVSGQWAVDQYNAFKSAAISTEIARLRAAVQAALAAAMAAARAAMGGPSGPARHGGLGWLEGLWTAAGGPANLAHLMAAIAMAESGGNAGISGPATPWGRAAGLWQILGLPFPGNPFDPMTNARMAVAKWRTQGLGAWEAYTNGSYLRFYGEGGPINEPILGIGRSGQRYGFHAGEEVLGGTGVGALVSSIRAMHREVAELLAAVPDMTGRALGGALNDAAGSAARRATYSPAWG